MVAVFSHVFSEFRMRGGVYLAFAPKLVQFTCVQERFLDTVTTYEK